MKKMSSTTRTIPYKRRREDKTNYKKRIKLLLGEKPRLVIRKSLKNMLVQLVEYQSTGDKILASAHTKELKKYDWKYTGGNLPGAYLIGLLIAKKALAKKQKSAIVDIGLQSPIKGTRLFAVLKGAVDAGMDVPHDPAMFPAEERIKGEHIAKNPFAKDAKMKEIAKMFEQAKQKIMKG